MSRNLSKNCSLIVSFIGSLVLIGWAFDIRVLKSVGSELITMKANTALCFLMTGIALSLASSTSRLRRQIIYVLCALTAAVSCGTLMEYLLGVNIGIDEILFSDLGGQAGRFPPGRLAPITAVNFMFIALALTLATSGRSRLVQLSQYLAAAVGLLSFQSLIGYAVTQTNLFGSAFYTKMAVHTAVALAFLSIGTIALFPSDGFVSVFSRKSEARHITMTMLISSVLIPALVRFLALCGFDRGLFDQDFAQLIQVVGTTALMAVIAIVAGVSMARSGARRRDAERLKESGEEKFKALVDASAQVFWTADSERNMVGDTETWRGFTGQSSDSCAHQGWMDAVHPGDREAISHSWKQAEAVKGPFVLDYRIKRADGEWRWTTGRVVPLFKPDGTVREWVGMNLDITEKKIAEESILESEARFRLLFDSMTQLAWIAKPDGDIYWYNKRWYAYTGTTLAEVRGWGWKNVHHPDHVEAVTEFAKAAWTLLEPWELTFPLRRYDGEWRWFLTRVVPVTSADGRVIQWLGTNTDIHEQKTAADQLQIAKDLAESARAEAEDARALADGARVGAERANHLKTAFLTNMSHEIRTPLGAMLGFADLMRDHGLTANERSNYINILLRNGEQLSRLINDILDLAKVESGHLTLEYVETDVRKICSDVTSLMQVKAAEKDLALEAVFDPTAPEFIISDPTRIRQILLNLVGNAIKFTPFGSVKVTTFGTDLGNGRRELCFEVADTGVGITEDQKAKLFQTFSQADETTTRRFGGTGLGLDLSRKLARSLGGDITITRSAPGLGTTFLIQIPDKPESKSAIEDTFKPELRTLDHISHHALEGLKILVVDDAPDNQQLIWRYLSKHGAAVESAENGLIGYRTALKGDFDLVLMDIQMPVMDGYTATQKLREYGYTKPVIALTAHAMNDIRKRALAVGYSDHLTKPIDPKQLISAIVRLTK